MKHFLFNHPLEIPATISGLLAVYLAGRISAWGWLFGIVMVSLYIGIFYHVKLYADMGLQFVFLTLQFYGLYEWLYGGEKHTSLSVRKADWKIYLIGFFGTIILFVLIAFILKRYTDSTTIYIDAFTTALSLIAQWMMCKKWLEHWLVWMAVDIISIKMYLIKKLYMTTGLYVVFFILCVMGYFVWKQSLNRIKQGT